MNDQEPKKYHFAQFQPTPSLIFLYSIEIIDNLIFSWK